MSKCLPVRLSICPTNQEAALLNKRENADLRAKTDWGRVIKPRKSDSEHNSARHPFGLSETDENRDFWVSGRPNVI